MKNTFNWNSFRYSKIIVVLSKFETLNIWKIFNHIRIPQNIKLLFSNIKSSRVFVSIKSTEDQNIFLVLEQTKVNYSLEYNS